ncbi:MAG: sigma 54-interacting transcriptional regulator [Pseudomonadota bacterium]
MVFWNRVPTPAQAIAARFERWAAVDQLLASPVVQQNLVGESRAWTSTLRRVIEIARFSPASLLLVGESGTGKELVARLVHALDARPGKKKLVVLDCTTVAPELAGSEFFGHEKGAFTGAVSARDGAFALADGGTLFLDEVGELPMTLQAELLRVVQEQTYKRVGSNTWRKANFRLVCATNRDLVAETTAGQFRADFYYRIASCVVQLPPLRDRRADILPLAHHFLRQLHPSASPTLDPIVQDYLMERSYPGNVRELRQLIARMSSRHAGVGPVTAGDIPEHERPEWAQREAEWQDASFEQAIRRAMTCGLGLKNIEQAAGEVAIRIALERDGTAAAAQRLGVSARALQLRRAKREKH